VNSFRRAQEISKWLFAAARARKFLAGNGAARTRFARELRRESASNERRQAPHPGGAELNCREIVGVRPGGDWRRDSTAAKRDGSDRFLGNRYRTERSSTDANIPLSQGIPAISIGGGGRAGGAHTWANGSIRRAREGLKSRASDGVERGGGGTMNVFAMRPVGIHLLRARNFWRSNGMYRTPGTRQWTGL